MNSLLLGTGIVFSYQGYEYKPQLDQELEDGYVNNQKLWHNVKTPEGKIIHFDCSPYHEPTEEEFQRWIDLECPDQIVGNFASIEEIEKAAELWSTS